MEWGDLFGGAGGRLSKSCTLAARVLLIPPVVEVFTAEVI